MSNLNSNYRYDLVVRGKTVASNVSSVKADYLINNTYRFVLASDVLIVPL